VLHEPAAVAVEPSKLLDNVRADIAVLLLDLLRRLERRVGLTAVSEKRLDKVGNISTGDWDRLDG
jgi:hypothetical protein